MTLVEIIVVMGIFSIVAVITLPFTVKLVNQTRTSTEAKALSYAIFRQQQDAYAGLDGSSYGVAFTDGGYTVFSGPSLASANYSNTYNYNGSVRMNSIDLAGNTELVFANNSLKPSYNGYISLIDKTDTVYKVKINSEGMISYEQAN